MRWMQSLTFGFLLFFATILSAQNSDSNKKNEDQSGPPRPTLTEAQQKDLRYAQELHKSGKPAEALPLVEKLYKEVPKDYVVVELLADCLVQRSSLLDERVQQKADMARARKLFGEAKLLGDNDYAAIMFSLIPEDGALNEFSKNPEIQRLMVKGEAEFSKRDMPKAREWYMRVALLEPNNYSAVLFVGDTYFSEKQYVSACEWFSRAAKIDPNQETAHRYWADALLSIGRYTESRDHYIDAAIAGPYDQRPWSGINKYVKAVNGTVRWYKFHAQSEVKETAKPNQININIDPSSLGKKDGSSAWMFYGITRASWRGDRFKKEFPNEKEYRHSLKEEAGALDLVATMAREKSTAKGKDKENLNDELKALVELKEKGLIEAYVLLNTPDAGIVQDYEQYRKEHRDVLVRYLREFVLPQPPQDKK